MKLEKDVWNHYRDYLKEATGQSGIQLNPVLESMMLDVSNGCSRLELKEMMKAVFTPSTIMQSLEQWQNQMDILLYTGMASLDGLSRYEYYSNRRDESPYTMEMDAVIDDKNPGTPIYELSCISQDVIHMASEWGGRKSPDMLKDVQVQAGLQNNWELQMLIGDCYRQNQEFDKAIRVYENLWEENGHKDFSIQDAITFTKFIKDKGSTLHGKRFDDWIDDFHDYKKQETVRRQSPKVSRNDPCPCGSGKKYKQCCGRTI